MIISMCYNIQHLKAETCRSVSFLSVENGSLVGKYLHSIVNQFKYRLKVKHDHVPGSPYYREVGSFPLGREKTPKFL